MSDEEDTVIFFYFLRKFFETIGRTVIYRRIIELMDERAIIEFEGYLISEIHSLCLMSLYYVYFITPEYSKNYDFFHPSLFVSICCAFEVGFLINDTIYFVTKRRDYPELNLILVHHVVEVTGIFVVVYSGEFHLGAVCMLLTEACTLFINNIYLFPVMGITSTLMYKINSVLLTLSWIFFRFYIAGYVLLRVKMASWETYRTRHWGIIAYNGFFQAFYLVLNFFWFKKILNGTVKMLSNKRYDVKKLWRLVRGLKVEEKRNSKKGAKPKIDIRIKKLMEMMDKISDYPFLKED